MFVRLAFVFLGLMLNHQADFRQDGESRIQAD